jgi:hypothetical protein
LQLINRDFYNLYRERRRTTAREIDQYKLFEKAVNGLLITMRNIIEESEGGLYIQGIGYFCHKKSDTKSKATGSVSFFKRQNKKYKYSLTFFPDKQLKDWHITYNKVVSKKEKRDKYYIHFDLIESYYNAKIFANNLKDAGAIITYAT